MPTTAVCIQDRDRYHHSVDYCSGLRHLHWRWPQHEVLSPTDCRQLCCISCAAFDDQFRNLFTRRWSSPWCWCVWTTVMPRWLASLPPYSTVSSLSWTLQLGQSLAYVSWIISQSLWPVFTGFVHPSKSRSSSRLSSTVPCIAQLLVTCRINCIESPTCRRGVGWGQHLPTALTFVHHSWSLLETAHLLLVALWSGTVSLKMSHLLHRCQCFNVNWRLTCFGTRTRTRTLLLRHSGSLKFFTIGHYKRLLCNVM